MNLPKPKRPLKISNGDQKLEKKDNKKGRISKLSVLWNTQTGQVLLIVVAAMLFIFAAKLIVMDKQSQCLTPENAPLGLREWKVRNDVIGIFEAWQLIIVVVALVNAYNYTVPRGPLHNK